MRYTTSMTRILYILMITLILTGCGRISKPEKPKGSTYPQTYIVRE